MEKSEKLSCFLTMLNNKYMFLNKSNNRIRVFEIALEGGREWKFCLGELQSFNAFVIVKATFSKH